MIHAHRPAPDLVSGAGRRGWDRSIGVAVMHVAALRLELLFVPALTLRQKRRLLKSMSRTLRKHFNIAILEVGDESRASAASIGAVTVSRGKRGSHEVLDRVSELIAAHPRVEVLGRTLVDL